ncbi:MAG TPA: peptidoglycan DD-metalloendopeptidase family protein [Solimonas sp.]|nr:peptidoglycan DD-metalloendopeptidase family protein [Solimonas sp.]
MIRTTLALALLLPAAVAWANPGEPEDAGNEQRLAEVRERIEELQRDIESKKSRENALNRDVESAEKKISAVQAEISTLKRREQVQLARVRRAQATLDDADRQLDGQRQALAAQVRAAFVIGQNAGARLVLNLSDVQKVDRMITYYDYIARARTRHMQGMLAQVDRLRALRDKADEEAEALTALRGEQQQALARLQGLRGERNSQLSQLKLRLGDEESQLSQLRETEREVARLLQSIQKALREMPVERPAPQPDEPTPAPEPGEPARFSSRPFPSQKGKLAWPLRGPVLAAFGQPKAGGRLNWNGQWIGAEAGAPVHAVATGRVVYTGWMHRYGLIVILEHEGGYFTLYGHNQSIAHAAGDMVKSGDVIAAAGNTGGHDETGVYFEVRRGTQSLDPRAWLGR